MGDHQVLLVSGSLRDGSTNAAAGLRAAVHASDAILFCTPEYAGVLPGSRKNMLEWTIGDDQPGSVYGKRAAWVDVSSSPTGAGDAHESLRKVLGYAHADIVDDACASVPVTRGDVRDGLIADPAIRDAATRVLTALRAADGRQNWSTEGPATDIALADGVLYFGESLGTPPGRCCLRS